MTEQSDVPSLVSTDWLVSHLEDPDVRVIEVDLNPDVYDSGHIPGAIKWNWETQLQDQNTRDIVEAEEFEKLARNAGINNDTHVVLYGDAHNWFAAWALWEFNYFGYKRVSLLDGGREKWIEEEKPTTTEIPEPEPGNFEAETPHENLRAYRSLVEETVQQGNRNLVDVRSPEEFTGEVIAPEGMNETAQRGGHIPGAVNIPWKQSIKDDGTFKSREELERLYKEEHGVSPERETITYCRIGERSAHTWFVLKHLLGQTNVRNYDGSWTEWGNLVGAPIEKGS